MKKANGFFLALALAGSAGCRVDDAGLVLVSGEGSGGELGTGQTPDSDSTPAGTGGQGVGGASNLGGATGAGGIPVSDGAMGSGDATASGDASARGGAMGSGGIGSGGLITFDCATDTGGGPGPGGTSVKGSGGAGGAGGSPDPDGAIDSPIPPNPDASPEALADARTDVSVDRRRNDVPLSSDDARADAVDSDRPPMTLVWSDEFNDTANTGVDPKKWSYRTWDPGQVNDEVQKYTNRLANVFQDGSGNLVIRALDTPYAGNTYTSGRIESNGHFTFQYGRVEVRAQLPAGKGSFPGIIAMGSTGAWPQCGELALVEQYGQDKSYFYVSATAGGASDTGNVQYTFPDATSASSDFHIYSLDWYTDHIVFQVDGNEITRTSFAPSSPFATIPEYLVLDLALGGKMGLTIDTSAFPMDLVVDYVRVYSFQ